MKRVFIFGYYGFKNLGDEAILAAIVKKLKETNSSAKIYVLSYNVEYTENVHDVIGVSRNNIKEVLSTIKRADFVISGGGSLLQDVTSSRSLLYYLGIIEISKLFKKPVVFYSNGFGPVNKEMNRYLTRKIVNRVDKIIVRDEKSKMDMKQIGITKHIDVTIDATFVLESVSKENVNEILGKEFISVDKPLVGISVRPWYVKESFIEQMAQFADYIADKGINIVFIPMQFEKDKEISEKIIEKMKRDAYILKNEYKPQEMLGIIGSLKVLVGMRLHALIFAAIEGIPMIGLEYDPKISSFLDMVGQKNIGKVEKLDVLKLCVEFDCLWDDIENKAEKLKNTVMKLKEKVNINREVLREMMR